MKRIKELWNKNDQEDAARRRYTTMFLLNQEHENVADEGSSQWGGSVSGRRYIRRPRESAHALLHQQYFSNPCTYSPDTFRHRFRMHRPLCEKIMRDIANHEVYFVQKADATGLLGFSTMQKVACAIRQLAYGTVADLFDDTWGIAESTSIEILKMFTRAICNVYGEEYLRRPTAADLHRLLAKAEERGFPGMQGSLEFGIVHSLWLIPNSESPPNINLALQRSLSSLNFQPSVPLFEQ